MVERLLYTQDVGGSSPSPPTSLAQLRRQPLALIIASEPGCRVEARSATVDEYEVRVYRSKVLYILTVTIGVTSDLRRESKWAEDRRNTSLLSIGAFSDVVAEPWLAASACVRAGGGMFYPKGLPQKRELEFASRALTSIEINGTYYSTFKPESWAKWRDETPDGFVFSVKASRYCTNRKLLASMGESMEQFIGQGMSELGDKLGPIEWQFMETKKFDAEDFEAFLKLLPKKLGKLPLRHALEVRSETFKHARNSTSSRRNTMSRSCLPTTRTFRRSMSRPRISPMRG